MLVMPYCSGVSLYVTLIGCNSERNEKTSPNKWFCKISTMAGEAVYNNIVNLNAANSAGVGACWRRSLTLVIDETVVICACLS